MTGVDLTTRREALGLSMNQLAKLLDVEASTISRWERGGKIQSPNLLHLALRTVEREHKKGKRQ